MPQRKTNLLSYETPETTVISLMTEQFIAASETEISTLEDMTVIPIFDDPFISII